MATNAREADAQRLFNAVVANDVGGIERLLRGGNSVTWRDVIRYELSLARMLDTTESIGARRCVEQAFSWRGVQVESRVG